MTDTAGPIEHVDSGTPWWRRQRRLITTVALTCAIVLILVHLAGGWYFAGRIHHEALDAEARRATLERTYDVEVVAVGETTLTLADPTEESRRPGVWGVAWPGGYGLVAEISTLSDTTTTRTFEVVDGSPPEPGVLVDVHERAFPGDPAAALGEPPRTVVVDGPLGDYESWFYPGERPAWVLLLHGNGLDRLDLGKLLPAIRGAGHPVLIVTIRNDPGAPEDPSGMLRYGDTEWADLHAAVDYATGRGAEGVVLIAPSMGAAVALTFLERSDLAESVRALVFDSPLIDFGRTIDARAADQGLPLPGTLVSTAKRLTALRFGVNWDATGHLDETDRLTVPILVFHGTDDTDVPIETSRELAAARPDLVTLIEVDGATHLAPWNVDPAAYEAELSAFLQRLPP